MFSSNKTKPKTVTFEELAAKSRSERRRISRITKLPLIKGSQKPFVKEITPSK